MDPQELYRQKLLTISEAISMVRPHQTIAVALAASEPPGLLAELGKHKDRLEDVTVWVALPLRKYDFVLDPQMAGHFFIENWFYGAPDRQAHPQGRMSYIPNNLHQAAKVRLEANDNQLDIFWGTATPPDRRGFMSLSLGLVYEKYLIEAADVVVLEINENLPWTLGDTHVHISEVDYVVENPVPLFELPVSPPAEWEQAIGRYIAELIEDGSTLQLGIGGIPNAITAFLTERRDLGIHTEMFTDGMVDLYDAGVVTGRRKTMWKGKMVGAFALGTKKLYDFVDDNLSVEFQQGKVTNDPYVIARNHRMVSVNTALQVDLYGQVCSQSIGPRHYSGTGGQLDTHRGAQMSPGGRGIIALRSTAKGGTVSTITPMLAEGAQVTVASQDIDTVVTEHGVARLKGLSVRQRTDALIRIAHPDFRPWLREEAQRLDIVPRLVVPGFRPAEIARRASAPGVSAGTIRLGAFCDLSGPNAAIGMAALRGYSAYYEHVNRWGGVHGRRIELIVEDDAFDPTRTKLAAMKLVMQDEVFAIVSPLGTSTNLAVLDYLVEKEVPVVSPHSGLSTWATPLKQTYFALQPSYRVEGRILAQYTVAEMDARRIAIFGVDDHFGQEGTRAFVEEIARAEIEPVGTLLHPAGASTPDDWVARLSAWTPDLVLIYTYLKPAADLLLAAHRAGFRPAWLSSYVLSGPDLFRFAGAEATHGLRATSYPSGPCAHRGEDLFRKIMARMYGDETPGTHSRIGYAAAQLVVEGLGRAGENLTREGFIAALEGIENWSGGLLPPVSYSPSDHRGLTALALVRAIHGRWVVEQGLLKLRE
ncbi:MAG: ABC transporter substrate-binding protein [Anaerolineae bacterium]|nr:ABC transporter substrate-binding protein [Anaerolineae bacterium]